MTARTSVALGLAAASTTLTNLAYLREQQAAAALPVLSLRQPLHSLRLLLTSRRWLLGFAMESGGFALYNVRRWWPVMDEVTAEGGLVTAELVPASRAVAVERHRDELRLASPHFEGQATGGSRDDLE